MPEVHRSRRLLAQDKVTPLISTPPFIPLRNETPYKGEEDLLGT
jgi:hypothetical protein